MEAVPLTSRILALALTLGVLGLSTAAPAAASSPDPPSRFDAVVVVDEADLPALLASGYLDDYALVSAAEVGLDQAAVAGLGRFSEDAVLTPSALGLDTPEQRLFPGLGLGFSPFVAGFTTGAVRIGVPVFAFRPITVRVGPVVPFPRFRSVGVLVLPPPPPPIVLPPPPPPVLAHPPPLLPPPPALAAVCCPAPRPAAPFREVPIIPEADSLALVAGGLVALGALAGLRARRRCLPLRPRTRRAIRAAR